MAFIDQTLELDNDETEQAIIPVGCKCTMSDSISISSTQYVSTLFLLLIVHSYFTSTYYLRN